MRGHSWFDRWDGDVARLGDWGYRSGYHESCRRARAGLARGDINMLGVDFWMEWAAGLIVAQIFIYDGDAQPSERMSHWTWLTMIPAYSSVTKKTGPGNRLRVWDMQVANIDYLNRAWEIVKSEIARTSICSTTSWAI